MVWVSHEQPTRLWARRYGGDFDAAIAFMSDSDAAETQLWREQREAEEAARQQIEGEVRRKYEVELHALRSRLEQQRAAKSWWGFCARPKFKLRGS